MDGIWLQLSEVKHSVKLNMLFLSSSFDQNTVYLLSLTPKEPISLLQFSWQLLKHLQCSPYHQIPSHSAPGEFPAKHSMLLEIHVPCKALLSQILF